MMVSADVSLAVGDDASGGAYSYFARIAGAQPSKLSNFDRSINSTFTLTNPANPTALGVADMEHVRGIYIEVNNPAAVTLDATTFQVQPGRQGGLGKLFIETDIAAITVAAVDPTLPVQGTYCVWGLSPAAYAALQGT